MTHVQKMKMDRARVGWRIWFWWVFACAAGGAVTMTLTGAMIRSGSLGPALVVAVFGSVLGTSYGITQWLVLRRGIARPEMWVLASAMGGAVVAILGFALGEQIGGPLGGSVIGAALGVMQWLVLRRRFPRAVVWVLVSIVGFALGLSAGEAAGFAVGGAAGWLVGGALQGVVVGAITGAALLWLLRQPDSES